MKFLARLLITMVGLWIASLVVPGIELDGFGTVLLAAFLLGIVNAIIKPLFVLFTLPLTILTLGLFLFVINAAVLGLVAALLSDFTIAGFWAALFGSVVVSLFSWCASWFIGQPDE